MYHGYNVAEFHRNVCIQGQAEQCSAGISMQANASAVILFCASCLSMHVCRAKDSYAQLASAWRLVQVQQQYAVTLNLPLTLPAASLTAAQAQADALTTASNATDALAAAVSAGLISGSLQNTYNSGLCQTSLFVLLLFLLLTCFYSTK